MSRVPVVIPSYEPDAQLLQLCEALSAKGLTDVVIVDDGSGPDYASLFETAEHTYHFTVLRHAVNLGKGRGLKTAFNYLLNRGGDLLGCVTADSDGQHTPEDILRCIEALEQSPDKLILGCRDFDQDNVPTKSKYGNKITRTICRFLCGVNVTDTQTGLRAISRDFMAKLMNCPGERFEFETNMLIETKDYCEIGEISIETVYDSKTDHKSHFHPVRDSIRIYKIFGRIFGKFLLSSVSSFIIDILLFSLFCGIFQSLTDGVWYAAVATVLARVISAVYNYLVNYALVFHSGKKHTSSAVRYFLLALVQMCLSAGFVTLFVWVFGTLLQVPLFSETVIKIVVDTVLFLFSYYIQRKYVF
ncbi:MAG: bifunctional glycosyltransferase family 2/GtrA family protein [Oscillospiraceae bacterium]|nr:bifunctional glycosyltransferase family 2/GtrA family protein [Oscillospiraceae bacterium]